MPAPQGSKKAFAVKQGGVYTGKTAVMEQSAKTLNPWRDAVCTAAVAVRRQQQLPTLNRPLALKVVFFLPRPKSVNIKKRLYPSVAPDLSKLLRAVEDAITDSGLWRDDCLVVESWVSKCYATDDPLWAPGALITVSCLD